MLHRYVNAILIGMVVLAGLAIVGCAIIVLVAIIEGLSR